MGILATLKKKYQEKKFRREISKQSRRQASEQYSNTIKKYLPSQRITAGEKIVKRLGYQKKIIQTKTGPREISVKREFSPESYRLVSAVAGRKVTGKVQSERSGKSTGRVGRPRGPSGKYIIPGKGAVGVFEYRKYLSYQKRLNAIQQQQRMAQLMRRYSPQQIQQMQMQQQVQQQQQMQPQQVQFTSSQPQQFQQQPQFQPQVQPPLQQPTGLSLNSGWELLKVGMPNTSPTPQPQFQSQTSPINLNKGLTMFQVEQPVTNPQGDWYTQPDLFTGRQVLRRRIREESKW